MLKKTTILELIVVLYTILFLYTGISKLMEYSVFKEQIATSPILAPISKPIAAGLPWTEFLVTLMLIIPKWRLKGLYAAATMMTLFTIYITATLMFSEHIPCSCGGVLAEMSWTQHIIFNTVFIAMSILGIMLQRKLLKESMDNYATLSSAWGVKTESIKI